MHSFRTTQFDHCHEMHFYISRKCICLFSFKNTGHCIPKDTIVVSNLWYMMHDPDVWDDPYEFKPERFLDTEGHLNKNTALVPFGIGKE